MQLYLKFFKVSVVQIKPKRSCQEYQHNWFNSLLFHKYIVWEENKLNVFSYIRYDILGEMCFQISLSKFQLDFQTKVLVFLE